MPTRARVLASHSNRTTAAAPLAHHRRSRRFCIYETQDPDVAEYLKNNKPPPGVHWHRQLTDNIGVRALVSRCYEIVGMAKECRDMRELRDKVARHYGRGVVQFSLFVALAKRRGRQ